MKDKIVLVTGASTGIGFVTALELARMGAQVILVSRNAHRAEEARQEIALRSKSEQLDVRLADLSLIADTQRLAAEIRRDYPRLDVLVNNAGIISGARQQTPEGLELTFALDHLGYFVLTQELMPLLEAAGQARIINLTSEAHKGSPMIWDDLQLTRKYNSVKAYCQAKLANLLFTFELARRLEGSRITCNAVHPGAVATEFGSGSSLFVRAFVTLMRPFFRSREKGAETSIYLASAPEVATVSGKYFVDKKPVEPHRRALSRKDQERLWRISEELVSARTAQTA